MIELKDIQGNVIYTTEINKGAKRKYQLMKEDYITLPFSLETPITFGVGCNTEVNGELFEVTDSQRPTYNNATGGYDYQLRLDAYYWKWKNKIFKFTPEVGGQEALWSLTASLDVHLNVFLANLKALGYTYRGTEFEFSIDATVENKAMSMTYENTNMIDALSAMAESWQCEWWITDNIINFGRCEYGTAVDFEIHKNVAEMTSSASQSPYATRLYVFGSTNNIPTNYRPANESLLVNGVVQKRLMLPEGTPYLDAYEGMKQEEAIEEVVIIEDIYPKTEGKIDSVDTYEDSVENEDGTTATEIFYRFTDGGINFSKDYIIEGQELKVKFTSGSLNGMEFGVVFNPNEKPEKLEDGTWNTEAQLYEVVINDDYGRKLPDSTLHPKIGDTYILIGWDSTKIADLGLISKAEDELLLEGKKILEKRKIDPNTYNCKMFSDYMFGLNEEGEQDSAFSKIFEIGDKVKLINHAYFENGRESRIIGYEYNLDFPYDNPIYIIGETFSYSRLGELESKLESLTFNWYTYSKSSSGAGGVGVYIIGTNDTTKPTNKNVFSAARAEKDFLSKQKDDIAKGNITFEKNIRSKDFVQGMLMGAGWSVYRDSQGNSVIETDKVIVRQSLKASELIINQETFEKGSNIYTKAGCTITKVEVVGGVYRCYYDNEEGSRYSGFKYGDQARCQRYDKSFDEIIKYYWRLVVNVGDDYVDLSMTDCDGDGIPAEGDDIAQLGNRYEIARQSAIIVSPDNGGSVVIWAGINSFNLSEKNMVGMGVNPNTGRSYLYGYGDMFFGDRNLESNFITYQQKEGDSEPKLHVNADITMGKNSTGLSNLSEFKDMQNNVENLFGQIEREFTIWYFDPEPTLENEPAVNWTTDETKRLHDQDIYFSDALARAWRFVNGQWVEITDERTLAVLNLTEENNNYIKNVLPVKMEEFQKQIDGAVESFFYEYDPSLDNEPASLWDTDAKKKMHLADTFTNINTGYSWRWALIDDEYQWIEISDTAIVEALLVAGRAQDTADQKRRTFTDIPYTPYDEGDLWVQGEKGDIMRCIFSREKGEFNPTDWEKAGKYTDDSALEFFINGDYKNQLNEIKQQIDTRAETWYQATDPALQWTTASLKELHIGDLWYDTKKDQTFMWNGAQWVTQGVPDEVFDKIDGKAAIYVEQPESYKKNDLWILEEDRSLDDVYKAGTIVVATQSSNVFKSTHWTKMDRYTDDTKAEEALRKAMSYSEALEGVQVDMEIVKAQVDREFTIWYYDPVPTLDNEPAVAWITEELKNRHDQDIYFSDSLGRAWRFQNGEWIEITDERTIAALNKAQDAMEESEEAKKVAEEAAKTAREANNYIENVLPKELDGIKNQIDGAMESFFEEYDPTTSNYPASEWDTNEKKEAHLEDTFTNLLSGYSWRWTYSNGSYEWTKITNTATIQALELAGLAKDTADGKRRVFTNYPYTPYDVGDLWVQGEDGDIMRCIYARGENENYYYFDWEKASKYTDDTKAEEVEEKLSDLDYLKEAFGDDNRVLDGGILMGKIVCVRNSDDEVVAFINGSDFAKSATHGKLVFASGIPSGTSSLESRSTIASTRIYEDGTIVSNDAVISGEINATSGVFEDVQIKGSIRSPWKKLSYKVLYWASGSVEQWGYDGSAIYDDKIRLSGGIGTPELIMAWGDDADGREIVISNENTTASMGVTFGVSVKVKVPTGKYIVDEDGTKISGGEEFSIGGMKIYYLTGFYEGWVVNKVLTMPN